MEACFQVPATSLVELAKRASALQLVEQLDAISYSHVYFPKYLVLFRSEAIRWYGAILLVALAISLATANIATGRTTGIKRREGVSMVR